MDKIIITGINTDVGKTIVSAIFTVMLRGDYWKPVQCGGEENSDSAIMAQLIDTAKHCIHSPAYTLKAPLSPHHAARLEGISINEETITPPQTSRPLIIETAGGVLVPLTVKNLSIDLFKTWNARWVVVSRHYLGSINHTLLTLEVLKQRGLPIAGLIFNGEPNPDTEAAILDHAQLPCLGRLLPEPFLTAQIIQRYATQWQPHLSQLLP